MSFQVKGVAARLERGFNGARPVVADISPFVVGKQPFDEAFKLAIIVNCFWIEVLRRAHPVSHWVRVTVEVVLQLHEPESPAELHWSEIVVIIREIFEILLVLEEAPHPALHPAHI